MIKARVTSLKEQKDVTCTERLLALTADGQLKGHSQSTYKQLANSLTTKQQIDNSVCLHQPKARSHHKVGKHCSTARLDGGGTDG